MLILCSCSNNSNTGSSPNTRGDPAVIPYETRMDAFNLLGLTSVREFELETSKQIENTISLPSNESNFSIQRGKSNSITSSYTYPFDYVKILSAYKLSINIPEEDMSEDLENIENNCGLGTLEIYIADFATYITDNEQDMNENDISFDNFLDIADRMITIKGSKGLYTILNNSGSYQYISGGDGKCYKHSREIFSSHKTITTGEIVKDFTSPFYGIQIDFGYNNRYSVSFTKQNDEIADYQDFTDKPSYSFDVNKVEEVSRNTIYNMHNLVNTLPQKNVSGTIEKIYKDSGYFILKEKVIIDSKEMDIFKTINIDEMTEYKEEVIELESLWNLIEQMEKIKVSYDYLYDGYAPIEIYANSIDELL